MKQLHRPDLFGWSVFDTARNIDFHGLAWIRPEGNVLVDPMPMGSHDLAHLVSLGGAEHVILTNSDHVRAAEELRRILGARVHGPAAERDGFPLVCDEWLADGDEPVPGMVALALDGSKTPGELALVLDGSTLITGDLVRAHAGGRLTMLPDPKLADRSAAVRSVQRLAELPGIDAVLPGDGWPVFRDGGRALAELAAAVAGAAAVGGTA